MEFSKMQIKPLSGESDWLLWKYRIKFVLDCHSNAINVVEGKFCKPLPVEGATPELQRKHEKDLEEFKKANNVAMMVLTNSMTEETLQKVMRFRTAREVWQELHSLFEATSENQLYNICLQFFQYKWTSEDNMSAHLSKLKNLWNELNIGLEKKKESTLPEMLLICKILDTLPQEYRSFKSSWLLLSEDKRTVDELTTQLCSYEREVKGEKKSSDALDQEALSTKVKFKQHKYKNKCSGTCNYCHQRGHWVRNCAKWIADGRPPKTKQADSRDKFASKSSLEEAKVSTSLIVVDDNAFSTEVESSDWYIDNGASKHITKDSHCFIDFENFDSSHGVTSASRTVLPAVGKGTIRIVTFFKGQKQIKDLKDVWYVPGICKNLFSVLATQDRNQNSKFESTTQECWLKINKEVVLYGARNIGGGLYKAAMKVLTPEQPIEVNMCNTKDSILQLYHERWGHQDKRHIKSLLELELGIKTTLNKEICEACVFGKSHRLKFGTREKATKAGELVSTDVCGPFDESYRKFRYFVIFKDCFTKFRYVYFLRQKSEVCQALVKFLAHASNKGQIIKELLSDNGGEFDNQEVKAILEKEGISQRFTAPYTPQQNGSSERENRTTVEMARTLKHSNTDVDFPSFLWAELVKTAVYILNRTGISSIPNVSPHEMWFGKKPRIKHMRIIGSLCYAHIPGQKRKKMDKKAVKGYLLGYDGDERFRIYVKETRAVICSRDVIFEEKSLIDCEEKVPLSIFEKNDIQSIKSRNEGKSTEKEIEEPEENLNSENESEEEDKIEHFTTKNLRPRAELKKPLRYEDYIMCAEAYVTETNEPETYGEAIGSNQSSFWKKAMDSEMASLIENETWTLENLPKGAKAIPCKWVYRIKKNPDGTVDKYKARLVIKGFSQRYGIDYNQTFSPVTRLGTVRSILSIAASEKMHLIQFDVSTAFLYGRLEETIYMKQPEGYSDGTDKVCSLKRSLYGLKQAPRCWNQHFGLFLKNLGFKVSDADPCLYVRQKNGRKLLIALYVDDGLVASSDQQDLDKFISELQSEFKITVKPASYFLGLEIESLKDGSVKISQHSYAKKILQRFGMSNCKPVHTPIIKEDSKEKTGDAENCTETFPYREAVGALMYMMVATRPDLAYSIGVLSRKLENPTKEDWIKVKRVFRYVASTVEKGIIYRLNSNPGILECYSDADYGGCQETGRSTSGVVIIHAGGAISWLSQRQATVALSTTEAEIVAANEGAKEMVWLKRLFQSISHLKEAPTLFIDNTAAIRLAQNAEFHRRTKHISIKHFFIREKVLEGVIVVQQIGTEDQVADIMTKPLHKPRLQLLSHKMGLS